MTDRYRLTFVCMGNICRSPTAEGVMRHKIAARHWQHWIVVDSAGTHAYHLGEAPDPRSQQHARQRGYDLSMLREDRKRPESVKTRILSRHGHLSNDDAARLVASITSPSLRHVVLAHLSEDCNTHSLAIRAVAERLQAEGHSSPRIHCPGGPDEAFPFSIEI